MPHRSVNDERGAILLVTLLVLFALSGLALVHLTSVQVRSAIVQQRVEDDAAFLLAEAGSEHAKLLVRNLDDRLDTNGDRQIDSKDAPYRVWNVPIEGGSYDYAVQGSFANEHEFYFRLTGGPWNRLKVSILEDGVEAASVTIDSESGGPDFAKLTTSIDTDLHGYELQATVEREKAGALNLWMKIDEPFEGNSTEGAEKMFTFDSAVDGAQTQSATSGITSLLARLDGTTTTGFAGDVYEIEASGRVGHQRRNLRLVVERNSLLKYARFSKEDIPYGGGAVIKGYVYAGRDLTLSGAPVTFRKPVQVVRSLVNQAYGAFTVPPEVGARVIELPTAEHLEEQRLLAKKAGIYSAGNLQVDLGKFDFSVQPPRYDGQSLPAKFNGVVFSEGDLWVQGKLQGASLTLIGVDDVVITGSIYTGLSDAVSQRPVNVGLVAGDMVTIHPNVPRIVHVNAALLAMDASWKAEGAREADHPAIRGTDLDGDGQIGGYNSKGKKEGAAAERKYNKSKQLEIGVYDVDDSGFLESPNSLGWNEHEGVDEDTWVLLVRGPIITAKGGNAGIWSSKAKTLDPKQTRSYQYDPDITRYAPPHFPLPLSGTTTLSFAEMAADRALVPTGD